MTRHLLVILLQHVFVERPIRCGGFNVRVSLLFLLALAIAKVVDHQPFSCQKNLSTELQASHSLLKILTANKFFFIFFRKKAFLNSLYI